MVAELGGENSLSGISSRLRRKFEQVKNAPAVEQPSVYGFSLGFAKNGQPVFQEFGNVSAYGVQGYVEPITDVIEKHEQVSVIVELPGVAKDEVDLRVSSESVYIKVDTEYRKYLKDVKLSCQIKPESTKANFLNGVLEINLKRASDGSGGKKVKIQ